MSKVDHVIKSKTRFKHVENLERFQKRRTIIFARGGLKVCSKYGLFAEQMSDFL